jgi:UDP-N-acetylmuramate--alanine ligase
MSSFTEYYIPGKHGHLIGIGGVSMSPLAEVLAGAGLVIAGSDLAESDNTVRLRKLGIDIHIGHAAENIAPGTDFVVRTAAVHNENPEITEARRRGIPIFERTEAWGAIMRDYKNALCIAGTHGKTTTTSMCTHILMAAQKDPTVMIGGTSMPQLPRRATGGVRGTPSSWRPEILQLLSVLPAHRGPSSWTSRRTIWITFTRPARR